MAESGSKGRVIGYWVATGLTALAMGGGGMADVLRLEQVVEIIETLGYPVYVLTIIGVAKILGVVVVLVPGFARLKEWAYAGFSIDLIGATASHAFVKDPIGDTITPLIVLAIVLTSWWLRPESRKLPDRPEGVLTQDAASE